MLKKIRHGFIAAAMASYGVVMLVLVAGINIANYMQTASMQDQLAMDLLLYGPRALRHPGEGNCRAGERKRSLSPVFLP